jgi:hypothetical protein
MGFLSPLRRRLRTLVRGERGMALPTAIFATVASFALASTAVVATVDTQHGTARDHDSKEAIAAADAGANVALLRLNRYATSLSTSSSSNCLGVSGTTLVITGASADGWCPAIGGVVGESTYSYRVTPLTTSGTMSVISTGSSSAVARRVSVSLKATSAGSVLTEAGLIGQEWITLENSADVRVSVGTNGDVSLSNSATICGNIREGVGKGPPTFQNSAKQCSGYVQAEGNQTLPAVSTFMPTDISTNNSNYRLVKCTKTTPVKEPTGCESDTYSSNNKHTWPWESSTRTIDMTNSSTLTLGGSDYFVCKVSISNSSTLYMAAGAHVRIFFDTPENCGLSSGTAQLEVGNSSSIKASGYEAGTNMFDMPGFYIQGSTTRATTVSFGNSSGSNEFVLYAPNSSLTIDNSATFIGAIAAKTVKIRNSARIEQPSGFSPPQIGGTTIYSRQSYVECTGATASPPNAGC